MSQLLTAGIVVKMMAQRLRFWPVLPDSWQLVGSLKYGDEPSVNRLSCFYLSSSLPCTMCITTKLGRFDVLPTELKWQFRAPLREMSL